MHSKLTFTLLQRRAWIRLSDLHRNRGASRVTSLRLLALRLKVDQRLRKALTRHVREMATA